ncbi:MAG TPA: UDP-glucose/GDP-mannose dehydrogenase family protein [Candidatus Wallbacteria bacterium]|nr:UDP-glucose/GDP-mannose dehydrogenase family protein [Candidatus Wallbacteria bacterium]
MKITIIGSGYVGLVTGTCFAEMGNDVVCMDIDSSKIEGLKKGVIPIYEPGLEEMVKRNIKEERMTFTTDIKNAVENSLFCFIAVGTPPGEDGSADLKYVLDVAAEIGKHMNGYKVVVDKSTVPVGTAEKVRETIKGELVRRGVNFEFDVVSNPEFLKEGAAIEDFMKPDRVVIGTDNVRTAELMKELYAPFMRKNYRIITMDIRSAELTKYAANCMLASRISFMNEMANICELCGADIDMIRNGIGSDRRIGHDFLFAGAGYGGSCFPKDVKALLKTAQELGHEAKILNAVEEVNDKQKELLVKKVLKHFGGDVKSKTFAVWGLAFKPKTDDMREAPSVVIINKLIEKGAKIQAFDPEAIKEAKKIIPESASIKYFETSYKALEKADALILVTEWGSFREPDFDKMKKIMNSPVIFDGRNLYNPKFVRGFGFTYHSIGRP